MKKQRFAILLLALVAAVACRKMDDPIGEENVPVELALQLTTQKAEIIDPSKSNVDQGVVKDVNVWVFDGAGTLLDNYFIPDISNAPFVIRTTSGPRNLVFLANFGSAIQGATTLAAIDALSYTNLHPVELTHTPMAKNTGVITIPTPLVAGQTVSLDPIELVRLTAKITLTFDHSALHPGVTIKPTKIVLRQVPNTTPLFVDNTPTNAAQMLSRGDSLEVVGGIVSTDHTTAQPLFMLENAQGATSNTDPKTKIPPAGRSNYVSFIEITADYQSTEKSGAIRYRFYLGQNVTNNFDIKRNTWYQMSVLFRGKGGVNENTWRVDIGSINDKFLPKTYYLPYMSGKANYSMNSPIWSSDIAAISGTNPVIQMFDSVKIILLKNNYQNNVLNDIGSFMTGTAAGNLPIKVVGAQMNDTFIDVATLLFPHNGRFGSKSYYITQYIHIVNPTNQTSWKALSSADWLYIGNGATIQSFSSSGALGAVGYGMMKNLASGELLSSEVSGNSIAVRCTPNGSAVARRGQILFFDQNGVESARVFVQQNPSTYPVSPVHLAYVPGGIIKAGAFGSNGAAPATLPTNASTTTVYSFISPFYVASKETTTQQFADFLNDLGITNALSLGLIANAILDKTGVLTDYYGLNPASILSQLNTSSGMLSYTSGKWAPTQKQFYKNTNALAASVVSVGNYPVNEVGFFASADFNYWAMKYAGQTLNRALTPLLITELEWEAAARGITNRETVLAQFITSADTRKNGAYPYAASWFSTYNNGLTGTESGNIDVLTSFLWFDNGNGTWPKSSGGLKDHYIHPCGNLFANPVGAFDMNGNVAEWVFDNYNGLIAGYSFAPNVLHLNVCNVGLNLNRVIRGGDASKLAKYGSNVARGFTSPNRLSKYIGFRTIIR